jgi:glycosyltransferase involved in cell wall biosynthesis
MVDTKPFISVIICTYNRDKFIRKSLECLFHQSLDKNLYEIIVVDNNSTDSTANIAKLFIDQHGGLTIRYVFEADKGLSFARNRGMLEAKGEILTYVDDDAEAVTHFLESIYQFMKERPEVIGIGGKVTPIYPGGTEPAWMNRYLNGFVGRVDFGTDPVLFDKKMKYPAGCNMTYRKEILQKAGGFNIKLTFRSDDKYIFFQVSKISSNIYYLPQAMVYHNIDQHRLTFENFKRLYLKTGNEEKIRILSEGNFFVLMGKFFELIFKTGASFLLYFKFLSQEQEIKGRYIVFSQWFTLSGFLQKKVFVR